MARILLAMDGLNRETLERLRSLATAHELLTTTDRAAIAAALPEIEVAAGHIGLETVLAMPALRWYQQWGAGAEWIMEHPEIRERDLVVTNVSGVHAVPISEHLLAMILALARRLPDAVRAQDRHEWLRGGWKYPIFELAGKTMLLIGVGAIGQRTARLAAALDMHVIGLRRDPQRPARGVARMIGPEELDVALPEADLVVLTAPLTPETRQMIGAEQFARMKPTACIFNIGRGGTIDQDALVQAIVSGQIAGAGLDVTDPEPLPADSPLWDLDNVLITGHYSGSTPEYDARALAIFEENLGRYVRGEPLRNQLDLTLGIRVS
ncbi:MAG: D-2-hydroxyacid dehydrogenase [Anaerolineae bacterium]